YILLVQSVFENNLYKHENFSWVNEKYNYLYSITNGSYVNFPFPTCLLIYQIPLYILLYSFHHK
ncbi:hypothetical protein FDF59_13640, partial [Clostridium botulinum]|nr:hypothetical protein [Clostridium botulinum]